MNAFKEVRLTVSTSLENKWNRLKEGMNLTTYVDNSNWYFQFNTKKKN